MNVFGTPCLLLDGSQQSEGAGTEEIETGLSSIFNFKEFPVFVNPLGLTFGACIIV